MIAESVATPGSMTRAEVIAGDAYLHPSLSMLSRDGQLAREGLGSEAVWKASVGLHVQWHRADRFGMA